MTSLPHAALRQERGDLHLAPFESRHAFAVARWARTIDELRWLAPSTSPPLTAEKVLGWCKQGGAAWILVNAAADGPFAYGELNPMQSAPGHWWVGHAVVRPDLRGLGVGRQLIAGLLEQAFERLSAVGLSLIVFPDNAAAIRCYRGAGFKVVGEEQHQFGGGGSYHRLLRLTADSRCLARVRSDRGYEEVSTAL